MELDPQGQYRARLSEDPPQFLDRVDSPWDTVPDSPEYNQQAYRRVERTLRELARTRSSQGHSNTQGVLILGEAGSGKTHLLMRLARNLSRSNHILFVRKPNNEDAVAQHVWKAMVDSLARPVPGSDSKAMQLDDLLAHVFTKVLVPEFEQDIREKKDTDQRKRWLDHLNADPYNLFSMLGEGERRQANMESIRKRTLRYLQQSHPDVDQKIAHVLITYCFVVREERKDVLLRWLSGQDLDETEAKDLGLPASWVKIDETSSDTSTQQQREEQALRAIRTIGILSTYYQPLILAFDQLEGLRDQERLTQRWGDTVREIFTMAPNLLILTCIFPDLWQTWFSRKLDGSVAQRIAQQTLTLEKFGAQHGHRMLAAHLRPVFERHRLPFETYPFTQDDVQALATRSNSPRLFIQVVRNAFNDWLDGEASPSRSEIAAPPAAVTQQSIDQAIGAALRDAEREIESTYERAVPAEQDFFGRVRNVTETLLRSTGQQFTIDKATCGTRVMPSNFIVRGSGPGEQLCLAILFSEGSSFAARMRNLNSRMGEKRGVTKAIVLRDRRCRRLGPASAEHRAEFERLGGIFLDIGKEEASVLGAVYDTIVAIEEHDLSIGDHVITKEQLVGYLRQEGSCRRSELLRVASTCSEGMARAVGSTPTPVGSPSAANARGPSPGERATRVRIVPPAGPTRAAKDPEPAVPRQTALADVLIGDSTLGSSHIGVLGKLLHDGRRVGISFSKPQCMVLLGHMGSGKSYCLGVLLENALMQVQNLSLNPSPLCAVAFNYRRNPESRFEYWSYHEPNSKSSEVDTLRTEYLAKPAGIERVQVFGYGPEIERRKAEYRGLPAYPIQFRPDELGAEHWEILMKPPSLQSEYMDVVRDIIRDLFYKERLTYKNLEVQIQRDERLSKDQKRRARNRLSFAVKWLSDSREYEWSSVLSRGSLSVFDLRMQTMTSSDALRLCLIITDLVRKTRNGVNKLIVFDEAHEYIASKELGSELENAITQIRHDGLSFILASQYPDGIPQSVFKYLLTRIILKLPHSKSIDYVRKAAPNLEGLSPQAVSDLDLEQGVCFIQTDDDCTDPLLKVPQRLRIRPRCALHAGETLRVAGAGPSSEKPGKR